MRVLRVIEFNEVVESLDFFVACEGANAHVESISFRFRDSIDVAVCSVLTAEHLGFLCLAEGEAVEVQAFVSFVDRRE